MNNKEKIGRKNKRSQITIFVIIALIVVVAIALIFTVSKKSTVAISPAENPREYIEKCMKDNTETALKELLPKGGFANPENSAEVNGVSVSYLCFTSDYDKLCENRVGALSIKIQNEIKKYISPNVEKCFESVESKLKSYNYKSGETNLVVEISPKLVSVAAEKNVSFTKDGQTIAFNSFKTSVKSDAWDFIGIANEIVNQELTCNCGEEACNADVVKISMENPNFEASKPYIGGLNQEIYTIKQLNTGDNFAFAVRNCVKSPGVF